MNGIKNVVQKNISIIASKRIALLVALFLGILAFSVFGTQHLLHDHVPRLSRIADSDQAQHGRWLAPYVFTLTLHRDLVIFGQVLTVLLLVVTAMGGLMTVGHVSKISLERLSNTDVFLVLATLVIFPFNLALFYYTWMSYIFAAAMLLAVFAVYFLLHPKWVLKGIGVGLVVGAMATYQPSVSVVFTLIAGSIAIGAILPRESDSLRNLFLNFLAASILGILGALIYAGLTYLFMEETRVTRIVELSDYPSRILEVTEAAFKHFWVTQPDLIRWQKAFLLTMNGLAVAVAVFYGKRTRVARLLLFFFSLALVILATKTTFFLSPDTQFYIYRYNLSFGLLFSLTVLVLVGAPNHAITRYGARAVTIVMLWFFVVMDLNRQTILFRGEQHDRAIANRILARIEALPSIDFNQTYRLVRIGPYSNFRLKQLRASNGRWDVYADEHMDNGDIHNGWTPESMMRLLGSDINYSTEIGAWARRISRYRNFAIQQGRQPWPHRSSVFIAGTDIVVYMQ